jgi:hypothetical protein
VCRSRERLAHRPKALAISLTVLHQDGEEQSDDYLAMQSAFRRLDYTEAEREIFLAEAATALDRLVHGE